MTLVNSFKLSSAVGLADLLIIDLFMAKLLIDLLIGCRSICWLVTDRFNDRLLVDLMIGCWSICWSVAYRFNDWYWSIYRFIYAYHL